MEKRRSGPELPQKILFLCPNHHKEFDYSDRVILTHSRDEIHFVMNDIEYKLSLNVWE